MNLKWENILKYANINDLIILYYSKGAAIIIPKRYVNGNEDNILEVIIKNYKKK